MRRTLAHVVLAAHTSSRRLVLPRGGALWGFGLRAAALAGTPGSTCCGGRSQNGRLPLRSHLHVRGVWEAPWHGVPPRQGHASGAGWSGSRSGSADRVLSFPPPPGIQGAGRDAWGQLQAASGKRVVGSRWPGGRPRRQKRTEGAVLCDERGLCSEGLGLFFMSRLCFFNFTLFLKQGTPLKRDGEECTSEGKGIAARILGPSKPVGAGRRREAAPDSCGQRASLHGLGRVLRREVQTARNRSTRVV